MIETIRSKALKLYYEDGNGAKLPHDQLSKIARILTALDAVTSDDDIKQLGLGIHKLTGNMKDFWSIKVSANYRIVFRFEDGDIFDVDYVDYH
ncbi:type II toxin-antitoxin system RelE/ParE family toxin [Mucilaginibacter psychrotolerans]|uniref:Plasmid maintenance system killer n=1 Tax=Mucilaginibacter psychrotolerans TaxID=1524096 RepID=A0A4Y8SDV4_9SPHI|nr:type II toxin-antitoxin system RelE/ParE family toxin [Mucilaginibacter psychrotolerans]TFF37283.1 plasmid maintenance system killer [Mucilaginibacter psychrotolerans]